MDKTRKKFILYAMLAVCVLLTVLLAVINITGFSMVADDADRVTQRIVDGHGAFGPEAPADKGGKLAELGPDSPEMPFSARHFTVKFDKDKNATLVKNNTSALSDDEAVELAAKLRKEKNGKTGWINTVYRYRVYKDKETNEKYVTVLDQGRELLPTYRTLIVSVVGGVLGLVLCFVFLSLISRRLFKPLEDADRKQKQFLTEAEKEFKVPLTVVAADAEILELENGASEHTQSIRRQVSKLTGITRQLAALSLFETPKVQDEFDLSAAAAEVGDRARTLFEKQGKELTLDIQEDVRFCGAEDAMRSMLTELAGNALKFSDTRAKLTLRSSEGGYTEISCVNDTGLTPEGKLPQVFDRFVRLDNAEGKPGNGLGLSYLREAVKAQNGRVEAEVRNGEFIIRITL